MALIDTMAMNVGQESGPELIEALHSVSTRCIRLTQHETYHGSNRRHRLQLQLEQLTRTVPLQSHLPHQSLSSLRLCKQVRLLNIMQDRTKRYDHSGTYGFPSQLGHVISFVLPSQLLSPHGGMTVDCVWLTPDNDTTTCCFERWLCLSCS